MHSRTSSADIKTPNAPPSANRVIVASPNGERWRVNGHSPLVDGESDWDLAAQIVNLKLGNSDEELRTPPNSSIAAGAMAQLESSPLESSSDVSTDSSDPSDLPLNMVSHSRESSTDTAFSEVLPAGRTLNVPPLTPPKIGVVGEQRERPHSYSGGLSTAELKRLQLAGTKGSPRVPGETTPLSTQPQWHSSNEQPTYPSLAMSPSGQQQNGSSIYAPTPSALLRQEELQESATAQLRQFSPNLNVGLRNTASPPFNVSRPNSGPAGLAYGQPPRVFTPQLPGILPTQGTFPYAGVGPQQTHQQTLSLGNAQQMYEMMLPTLQHDNPAVARIQQQHGFRPTHQHSASDPASLRDAATLALLAANNMQQQQQQAAFAGGVGAGMYGPAPGLSLYGGQFYNPQDMYAAASADLMMAAAARLQPQYTGPYGVGLAVQPIGAGGAAGMPAGGNMQSQSLANGPSANNRKLGLYKTELCRSWEEKGTCRYGAKCQFAHGEEELRIVSRHPKYKTEICRTFWVSGSCPYGKRCCFIHTELPASGTPPGADGAPPPAAQGNRARSASTNSDPADPSSTSLLARISAKRTQNQAAAQAQSQLTTQAQQGPGTPTPVETTPQASAFPMAARPGALRVDTSALGQPTVAKENKSAYPSFPGNGLLLGNNEPSSAITPMPVTAHPDFGRHNSRLDLTGQTQSRLNKGVPSPNNRHSFNGTDLNLDFSTLPSSVGSLPLSQTSTALTSGGNAGPAAPRASGHARSGSAGNWSTLSRSSRLGMPSPYSSIASGGELKATSPWAASELAIGSSRLS